MKKILFLFFGFITSTAFAQYEIVIEAYVVDDVTKSPIPYVNIGFLQKGIGTVSNETGYFILKYDEQSVWEKEILKFSVLGYETLSVEANKLFDLLSNTDKIALTPKAISLDETVITAIATEDKQIGTLNYSNGTIGYWKDKIALGGEIGTRLRINKKKSKIKELKIRVLENLSDSLRIRINIYDYDKREPKNNIVNTNIFHTISIKKGIETINLKPYNIVVNNDVIVSIEVVEVFDDVIGFVVAGLKKTGVSTASTYTRYISQDKWKRTDGVAMNFSLLTSYPKSNKETITVRALPNKITLFWDTSNSMKKDRDIEKELRFIKGYLKKVEKTTVEVVAFSANINAKKTFEINRGNTDELTKYLENSRYDGATDFSKLVINSELNIDSIILFTDGNATLGNLNLETDVPVFCISSSENSNHVVLQDISFFSDGHYINLNKNTLDNALNFILNDIKDEEVYNEEGELFNPKDHVYGKVFDSISPIKGASIKIENSFIETISGDDGAYNIPAKYGDILVINYLGMTPEKVDVSNEKNIDIQLDFEGVVLDEISIKATPKKEETIRDIFAADGVSNAGGGTFFTSKDIRPSDLFIADVLRRVPGVFVKGSRENPSISIRGNTGTPLLLLDGGLIGDVSFVDPQNIAGIAVLRSLADTNKYGSEGVPGVILIRSKTNFTEKDENGNIINSALVTGNDYSEQLPLLNNIETLSTLKYLSSATSFENALDLYEKDKNAQVTPTIPFYIEASDYFTKWNQDYAYSILSNIADIAFNNATALKVLAYKLEVLGKLNEARYIYERITQLRPKDAQSYRDLALIFQNTGLYEEAMVLYKQMITNSIEDVDFSGLDKTIINELKHLLAFHKSKVTYNDLPSELLKVGFNQDVRIVFEWNKSNTEFEIQFVDPNKKYFKWQHTVLENKQRLLNENETGYFTEEFTIDDSPKGPWIINVQCLNEEPLLNPTFLKYTIYKNYGLNNETKEVRVIKLFGLKEKVTLDTFIYN